MTANTIMNYLNICRSNDVKSSYFPRTSLKR